MNLFIYLRSTFCYVGRGGTYSMLIPFRTLLVIKLTFIYLFANFFCFFYQMYVGENAKVVSSLFSFLSNVLC